MGEDTNEMLLWIDRMFQQSGCEDRAVVGAVVWAIGQFQVPEPRVLDSDDFRAWTAHIRRRQDCPPFLCWTATHQLLLDMTGAVTCIGRPSYWEQLRNGTST